MTIQKWKKSLACGLAFAMAFTMMGCGGKGGSNNGSESSNDEVKNMVFRGETLEAKDIKGDPSSFTVSGDKVYFYTMEWPEYQDTYGENDNQAEQVSENESSSEETTTEEGATEEGTTEAETTESGKEDTTEGAAEETTAADEAAEEAAKDDSATEDAAVTEPAPTTRLYSMSMDASDITEICEVDLQNNEYINYMVVNQEGSITIVTSVWEDNSNTQKYFVIPVDNSGKQGSRQEITKVLNIDTDTYVSSILTDDKGRLVVFTDKKILLVSADYKKAEEIKTENIYIESAVMSADRTIMCAYTDENGPTVQTVDTEAKKLGDKYQLDISYFQGSDSLINGSGEYDFYYRDDTGVYGYKLSDKKGIKLLDYVASEINSNDVYNITPLNADNMIGMAWNETGSVITRYTKVDPSEITDKETIVYGSLWGVSDIMKNAAITYNKESDKYRIEFKDYSAAGEDAVSKMNADIIAGNVPDIIDLSNLPVKQYAAKGILEDLTSYYDNDSEVKKEDIIPSVEKAMEIDGKLYYVSPAFSLSTLIAAKKDVGDKTGWTFDEFKELLEEKGSGTRPFYTENKLDILYNFIHGNVDDYIDWSTGKCRFDGDDFKSVLEISNQGVNDEVEYDEDSPSEPSLIKSGKVLLSGGGGVDTDYVQMYKKMYNGDITFIGYPCEDKQGSYFNFDTQVAIYSKSKVKDGAWDFIKQFMEKDHQAKNTWGAMPTNKDAFEMYMKTKTATKKYTNEYGEEVEPYESSWGWDDMEVKIGPLSAEEEQMYRDLIDRTTKVTAYNDEILQIIQDEAKNYFSGQKGLDETVDIIQNRVTTYVNENK